jgi:hypothetical protein
MEIMSKQCPRCEAYTLRCVASGSPISSKVRGFESVPAQVNQSLGEVWWAVEG